MSTRPVAAGRGALSLAPLLACGGARPQEADSARQVPPPAHTWDRPGLASLRVVDGATGEPLPSAGLSLRMTSPPGVEPFYSGGSGVHPWTTDADGRTTFGVFWNCVVRFSLFHPFYEARRGLEARIGTEDVDLGPFELEPRPGDKRQCSRHGPSQGSPVRHKRTPSESE